MRERFLIGRKEGWDRRGIYEGEYFIRVDYRLSTRLIPSSEVSERSTNCHVFEPAYEKLHCSLTFQSSKDGLFVRRSFVIPALPKLGPVYLSACSEAAAMSLTLLFQTNTLQEFRLKCFFLSSYVAYYLLSLPSCLE